MYHQGDISTSFITSTQRTTIAAQNFKELKP